MTNIYARCEGAFIGHALASQYDPSILMAINISDSMLECKTFDGCDILSRHLYLYDTNKCEVGEVTKYIYQESLNHMKHDNIQPPFTRENFRFDSAVITEMVKAADKKSDGHTAGCNPAQRSFPLAFCPYISDDDLFTSAKQEAALTHYSPLAGQVSGIVNHICRALLNGQSWPEAVQSAFLYPNLHEDVQSVLLRYHRRAIPLPDTHAAYAPTVLTAALRYVAGANNAKQAIAAANAADKHYCSAIVGILAGARWGIALDMYKDSIQDSQLKTIRETATKLSELWKSKHDPVHS